MNSRQISMRCRRHNTKILVYGLLLCVIILVMLTFCSTPSEQSKSYQLHMQRGLTEKRPYKIETNLLVVVLSAPSNMESRNVIRETWASDVPRPACVRFVVGTKNVEKSLVDSLNSESSEHHDLILLEELQESYSTLTLKLMSTLKWVNENVKYNFLLKVDEDTFVRIDKVLEELLSKPKQKLYWGFFDGRAHVRKTGKWAEKDFVLCDRYLPYALGGGYVISSDLVQYVSTNSDLLQLFKSEDVSLGAWLGPLKVNRVHDPNFDTEYKSRGCFDSYIVTHKKSPSDMQSIHRNIGKHSSMCDKEYRVRKSYIYDWNSLPTKCCERIDPSIP